ncbi:MAG: hypothetical protein Ct9H90mP14_3080 [Methanobacteriota archaeon]|nr:MAG: hypothetical protein Ct9H90mP14_3080 [Euryarchaeota archaeon]
MNGHYDEANGIARRYGAVNLGIATQTDRGLFVPVVKHAEAMDFGRQQQKCREYLGRLEMELLRLTTLNGSTFTITSLGEKMGGLERLR